MADIKRRTVLQLLGAAPVAAGFTWTQAEAAQAHQHAQAARQTTAKTGPYKPQFFNAHEWATAGVLANMTIPKDERSGSATDAGVLEFMDFMMHDQPGRQTAMRGGLMWLDLESQRRYDKKFIDLVDDQRKAILDDIAWPQKAKKEFSQGVAFFNSFRDLTASGFWSSKMGVEDLKYMGNQVVFEWNGCPDEVLKHLGITAASGD